MTTIGFVGAGLIGSTVARLAVDAGHDVVLSNSRGPRTLEPLAIALGERARAAMPEGKAVVTAFLDSIGYDTPDVGPLAEGRRYQRDLPAYSRPYFSDGYSLADAGRGGEPGPGRPVTADVLQPCLDETRRYRDL